MADRPRTPQMAIHGQAPSEVPLSLYNTLTKRKEEFVPLEAGRVKLYACGVTVYGLSHIGHARAAVVFDVLVRYMRSQGYEVDYVRNFTDVDDKIIKKAQEEGTDWSAVAEKYIAEFKADMKPLSLVQPTHEPRATEHIPEMISMIKTLMNKGLAYTAGGDVYFAVEKAPGYGKLSGTRPEEAQSGETGEHKKNPLDFALWKGSKPGEPTWESPWGPGRPGWHIECSAMAMKYLGETLDIHGGGMDLIFPHHENEMAQSEGATGKPFARYWVHNGFVNINREKMSKSLGNIFTLKEALRRWHPEAIRLFLLSSHYRSPVDFSDEALNGFMEGLGRAYSALQELDYEIGPPESITLWTIHDNVGRETQPLIDFEKNFIHALNDDLNTPKAIAYIFDSITSINSLRAKRHDLRIVDILKVTREVILNAGRTLGLLCARPEEFLRWLRDFRLDSLGVTLEKRDDFEKEITRRILQREEARKRKAWAVADNIRLNLQYDGIYLEDTPRGTRKRFMDEPLNALAEVVRGLKSHGNVELLFVSGRAIPDVLFSHQKDRLTKIIVFMGSKEKEETWKDMIENEYNTYKGKPMFIYPLDYSLRPDLMVKDILSQQIRH